MHNGVTSIAVACTFTALSKYICIYKIQLYTKVMPNCLTNVDKPSNLLAVTTLVHDKSETLALVGQFLVSRELPINIDLSIIVP